ncbi:glycosyltransferase [Flavihumibacter petaseus]|uniref:Putative glycosyltransferase n=1 Tax=Flavihumibacter petaseus NBRC 106054 TaxID=1220578 RepID=A0A0E9MX12_9BACT|nr:glycosyltransferase [Flavihumibacter petaseus]GAO41951.1 putative glycosyltransferase [Flavihumibacter petaseus NBRC 106054]
MKTMKNIVLFCSDQMQGFFGLGAHTDELLAIFGRQEDIEVTIIVTECRKYPEVKRFDNDRLHYVHIPCPGNGLFLSASVDNITTVLGKRILQVIYPILATKENLVFLFNSISELSLVKQVKDFFKCTVVYVHHGWSWKDCIKVEDSVFAQEWKDRNVSFCPEAFFKTEYQLAMVEAADGVVTVTNCAKEFFKGVLGVDEEKLNIVYNGIAEPEFVKYDKIAIRKEFGIGEREKIVLFSGRVVANKGVFFLVEAFRSLLKDWPDSRLVLIGMGSLGEVLRSAEPVWSRIVLTDKISRELLQKWYAIADVGVLPSLMEQCSFSAIEMRFWSIPLVVSAVDGLQEMFDDGIDCLMIPVSHDDKGERTLKPVEITVRIDRLLKDSNLSKRLTDTGITRARSLFTSQLMGDSYLQLIDRLIEK